jgi:hypothetical protein
MSDIRKFACALLCLLSFDHAIAGNELDEHIAGMRKAIAAAERDPSRESLLALGLYAYRMDISKLQMTEEYERMQKSLLREAAAIPGHAHIYADEIERLREARKDPANPDGALYNIYRDVYLIQRVTLYQSPEAVQVLGNFLHDFRDATPVEDGIVHGGIMENAYNAACALSIIELRDPPLKPLLVPAALKYAPDLEGALARVQEWWEKVESGAIPFSFVGQPVEYRFQPDGSVTSSPIAIPEEERERLEAASREKHRPAGKSAKESAVPESPVTPSRPFPWLWVVLAGALLTVAFGFYKIRK